MGIVSVLRSSAALMSFLANVVLHLYLYNKAGYRLGQRHLIAEREETKSSRRSRVAGPGGRARN